MLEFRDITTADIDIIKKYTSECGVRSCDFTLCGIYLWGMYYGYRMCVYNNTLFIKGHDESGRAAFALPIGEMDTADAVDLIRDYCNNIGIEARFSFIPSEALDAFKGGNALRLDGWSDYIYSAESLATLAGKKLHKKKNRFNKFVKTYPNYKFEIITADNIHEVRAFYADFLQENPSDDQRLAAEERIINRMLDEYALLGMVGGMIKVDGEVAAFAFGERVGDTLYAHFEKGNRRFDGVYEAMNCLFVRNFAEDAVFVDREEDMGDEGLRQAKESYFPIAMADKYVVIFPQGQ